jgi:hypothetical protein
VNAPVRVIVESDEARRFKAEIRGLNQARIASGDFSV